MEGKPIQENTQKILEEYKGVKYEFKQLGDSDMSLRVYHSTAPGRLFVGEGQYEETGLEYKYRRTILNHRKKVLTKGTKIWDSKKLGSLNRESAKKFVADQQLKSNK